MRNFRETALGLYALAVCVSSLSPASAQPNNSPIIVEESSAASYKEPLLEPFAPPISESAVDEAMETQYKIQLLEREIMTLRGLLEEVTFKVDRMRSTQDDRYLELDSRFQNLDAEVKTLLTLGNSSPSSAEKNMTVTDEVTEVQGEQTLYDIAHDLIRNKQYDLAISQLRAVINRFPEGSYAPNVYYWLGQVYAAKSKPDLESATEALEHVIQFYPEHRKVPDAAFKLGQVYNLLGDCKRSRDLLEQVVTVHQGKTVATLAEAYLRDKVICQS